MVGTGREGFRVTPRLALNSHISATASTPPYIFPNICNPSSTGSILHVFTYFCTIYFFFLAIGWCWYLILSSRVQSPVHISPTVPYSNPTPDLGPRACPSGPGPRRPVQVPARLFRLQEGGQVRGRTELVHLQTGNI